VRPYPATGDSLARSSGLIHTDDSISCNRRWPRFHDATRSPGSRRQRQGLASWALGCATEPSTAALHAASAVTRAVFSRWRARVETTPSTAFIPAAAVGVTGTVPSGSILGGAPSARHARGSTWGPRGCRDCQGHPSRDRCRRPQDQGRHRRPRTGAAVSSGPAPRSASSRRPRAPPHGRVGSCPDRRRHGP